MPQQYCCIILPECIWYRGVNLIYSKTIDWLILMARQPILVLFCAENFGKHCTFIFTFFVLFQKVGSPYDPIKLFNA